MRKKVSFNFCIVNNFMKHKVKKKLKMKLNDPLSLTLAVYFDYPRTLSFLEKPIIITN